MSAEILRRAASLMRERAEAATDGPWLHDLRAGYLYVEQGAGDYADVAVDTDGRREDSEHIASWHPTVALTVADWLDRVANDWPIAEYGYWSTCALAVARAYLGGDA